MRNVDLLNIVIHGHDDLRKRRIAVILAWGIFGLAVLSLLSLVFFSDPGGLLQDSNLTDPNFLTLFWGTISTLIFAMVVLLLTRTKIPANILGSILVIGTSTILFTSDSPIQLVSGPSTTLLLFPVFMSGVLIHSSAALIVAAILLIPFILVPGNIVDVNFYAWSSIMGLALVIWVACYVMEKAIREAREEAYRSNAMLGIASHELRTPLGVILGNLSILKLQNGGDKSNLVTETMERSADSLNETVSRLLDQAYVQSGKAQLQTSDVCVRDLVQEIADPIQALAKQKLLDFSISVSDSVPMNVMVDRLRVKQILTNLLENAVKYTDAGGISLAVDFHAFGERQLILSVKDTGIGIPRNRIRSMFKPFVQGQSYDTREYGGVGLGLSIVSQLVDLMKGKITVNSTVGAGSTFTVTIPLEA